MGGKASRQQPRIFEDRSCTDLLGIAGFIAGWIIVAVLFSQAKTNGADPNKIVRGVDINGRICGKSDGVLDKPLAAWPHPFFYKPKICVSSCNQTEDQSNTQMAWLYPSHKFVFYCIPVLKTMNLSAITQVDGFESEYESTTNMISRAIGDLYTSWPLFFASAAVALGISFVFAFLLRFIAGVVIWVSIALLVAAGLLLGTSLLTAANNTGEGDLGGSQRRKALLYSGYICYGCTGLFVLIVFALRRDIKIAVEVVKEGARAIGDMKCMVFFPLIPFVAALAYFTFWIAACLYIFSASSLNEVPLSDELRYFGLGWPSDMVGDPTSLPSSMLRFTPNENFRSYAAVLFFHMLWNVQFLFYFGFMVIAGSVASWYFTRRDHQGNKIRGDGPNELPPSPVLLSFKRTIRYHIGTIALASFLIALVQFARWVIRLLERQARPLRGPAGTVQRAVLCCLSCCLKCVECCLDKISKNALVWTAIWGDNFLHATCASFALIWRNLRKVAALNAVSSALLVVGKLAVSIATMAICGYALNTTEPYASEINSPLVPLLVVFILAYVVSSLFMLIFEVTIDTTLLCFLVDCEQGTSIDLMFASPGLHDLIGRHAKDSADIAESEYRSSRAPEPLAPREADMQMVEPGGGERQPNRYA